MSKSRDEFLDWYSSLSAKDSDEVCAVTAYEIWKAAWQASRKSLVVELPQAFDDEFGEIFDSTMIKGALDAAGVAYK